MAVVTLALTRMSAQEEEPTMDDIQAVDAFLEQLMTHFLEIPLEGKKSTLTLGEISGDDGVDYDEVEFIVTSRYKIAGDLWVGGSDFRINLSQHVRFIRAEFGL